MSFKSETFNLPASGRWNKRLFGASWSAKETAKDDSALKAKVYTLPHGNQATTARISGQQPRGQQASKQYRKTFLSWLLVRCILW